MIVSIMTSRNSGAMDTQEGLTPSQGSSEPGIEVSLSKEDAPGTVD
jgi:hypothetical protein